MASINSPGLASTLTKADERPIWANCWRCKGLQQVWPDGEKAPYSSYSIPCPVCGGVGLEMIPWTEILVRVRRVRGYQKWSNIRRNSHE